MNMNATKLTQTYEDLYGSEFQRKLVENPKAMLLDVRTPDEFSSGKIPKAVNINVMDISFVKKISMLDKSKTYFVYCRSGGRSGRACSIMAEQGFEVYNLAGGIGGWGGEIS